MQEGLESEQALSMRTGMCTKAKQYGEGWSKTWNQKNRTDTSKSFIVCKEERIIPCADDQVTGSVIDIRTIQQ